MADISQIKLPDGTTYNLKDSYVRTNYRALNNNDFDTINVTELNAGDLIVTGAARFLNTINGSISGNAVTATKATQDESGNNIKASYANSISISDHTITLKNKNGASLGTVTVPDNNTTYSLSASGESVVLSGSDNSSSTADLSSAFAKYTPYKGNLTSVLGSASPASAMKTYWDNNDNIKPTTVNTAYNTAGQEYAFLLSKGGSNQYGAVIRWGYGTKYFEILRKYGSTWKDDDWVKMDAGYADTAGSATSATSATTASKLGSSNVGSATQPIYLSGGTPTACTYTLGKSVPSDAVFTDTKNTAGSIDTSSKIFLIGATSQAANPQTYSDNEVYTTNGVLTTKSVQVGGGSATMEYSATTKSINFVFAS